MLILFETAAGHALFKLSDENKIKNFFDDIDSASQKSKLLDSLKLKAFGKFEGTVDALDASTALVEGQLSKQLKKLLKKNVSESEKLLVSDPKLGSAVKDALNIACVFDNTTMEVMRAIRENLDDLLKSGLSHEEQRTMALGLAHSLSRYKLKFSPDKVDTMIVQAIGLLDDLDKEINTYSMRLREWYGWHFPELSKISMDNAQYARVVLKMKTRTHAKELDFSDCVPNEIEDEIKQAAEISMGTEISEEDVLNISALATQVVTLSEYRVTLFEYLKNRMNAVSPNLTCMVGELVGARLIAHAGSLMNLAKYPASTVQILGAEKALFRALKTKQATPKYGLIYHASIVGQASQKLKGKISRVLAAKCALSIRMDALGEGNEEPTVGMEGREKVENRLRQLEGKAMGPISRQNKKNGAAAPTSDHKYQSSAQRPSKYNPDGDVVDVDAEESAKKKDKKDKKRKLEEVDAGAGEEVRENGKVDDEDKSAKKKKKSKTGDDDEGGESEKKKKKKKSKE